MGDEAFTDQAGDAQAANPGRKRQRTPIAFPYTDLNRVIAMCTTMVEISGAGPVELVALAAAMNQTAEGGTFRGRVNAARMFGVVETAGEGMIQLTDLGKEILDPIRAPGAKSAAFLSVPLYAKLYDQYKGYALPGAAQIERQMRMLGLPEKQIERARQVFASSVEAAGFINSNGRVIKPIVTQKPDAGDGEVQENRREEDNDNDRHKERDKKRTGGGGDGGDDPPGGKNHPLIRGLLVTLPEPGKEWSKEDREAWLTMAASIFKMIYPLSATSGNHTNSAADDENEGL